MLQGVNVGMLAWILLDTKFTRACLTSSELNPSVHLLPCQLLTVRSHFSAFYFVGTILQISQCRKDAKSIKDILCRPQRLLNHLQCTPAIKTRTLAHDWNMFDKMVFIDIKNESTWIVHFGRSSVQRLNQLKYTQAAWATDIKPLPMKDKRSLHFLSAKGRLLRMESWVTSLERTTVIAVLAGIT